MNDSSQVWAQVYLLIYTNLLGHRHANFDCSTSAKCTVLQTPALLSTLDSISALESALLNF